MFRCMPDELKDGQAGKDVVNHMKKIGKKMCDNNGVGCPNHEFCDSLASGGEKYIPEGGDESRLYETSFDLSDQASLEAQLGEAYETWSTKKAPAMPNWVFLMCGAIASFTLGSIALKLRRKTENE